MILVDTSVWINHFRRTDSHLVSLLSSAQVLTHPFVIGEIALGSLARRTEVLDDLAALPSVTCATDLEVLAFIDAHALHGLGVGYIDAHLLASTVVTPGSRLLTADRRLRSVAQVLGAAAPLS